jgi:hypothetical protein
MPARRDPPQDPRVAPYRIVLLATVCVLIMLCAGVVQLLGVSQMA